MDVEILSRLQFALTIIFHYLFPPLTIGLGVVLVYLEGRFYFTGQELFHRAAHFWTRIFALNFSLGVASGIVMEFEFGTNWAAYSRFVGDVFGSALAAEGVFAFFLESGFLAILVFGWDKVSPGMHFFSTCMVALGSIFSSVWIVVANSWQQTPAGHRIVQMTRNGEPWFINGEPILRAEIVDFWAMVLNPSSVIRLTHVLIGCFIVGAFFVLSISAYYLLKKRHIEFAKRSFSGALVLAFVSLVAAAISGHVQAKGVYRNQPAKLAAFEGHFQSGPGDLTLFALPDEEAGELRYQIAIPGGLSFLLFEDFKKSVEGLDAFKPQDRPPLLIPFITWRLMVGFGSGFLIITGISLVLLFRDTLFRKRWLLWIYVFAIIPAIIANHSGWIAAEVGRQPWIVHAPVNWNDDGTLRRGESGFVEYDNSLGLRTSDGLSEVVSAGQVLASIIGFGIIYLMLFILWIFLLNEKIKKGPDDGENGALKESLGGGRRAEA